MRLHEFALQTINALPITAKTQHNYLGAYRRYIKPILGQRDLTDVQRFDIQCLLTELSPPTAHQTLMVLKTIYREAERAGLLQALPTDHIRTERIVVGKQDFLTWEALQEITFPRYDSQIRFLALHGLRWGEAVALTESDIYDGRVWITRSIHGQTKTAAGVRSVPYIGHFQPFPKDRRSLARLLTPYGVTIHSLRKTYAYLLKRSGVHVSTAQKLLGHSSPTLTLAVYTKVLDHEVDEAGQQMLQLVNLPDQARRSA